MANLHHGVRAGHTWGAHPPPPLWLPRRAAGLGTASARSIRPETTDIKSHIDPRGVVRQRAVPLMVTCAQCRQEVLEADQIGDEEECALRDHLLASHPNTLQPETFGVLLRHFVVTERAPPAGALTRAGALRPKDD